MPPPWNLSPEKWPEVLSDGIDPKTLAASLIRGHAVPWTEVLLQYTQEGDNVLDLGSGRGEHSAILSRRRRNTVLLDWSLDNIRFSEELFQAMGISGKFCQADITKPLPFQNRSCEVVFSCGVFEYFTRDEIRSILREVFRISTKRIIIMVPNGLSLAYRIGKSHMERNGKWPWGGEVPSYSLKSHFRSVGKMRLSEFSVGAKHSLNFLTMKGGSKIRAACSWLLGLQDSAKPSFFRQGYLLISIGEKD
jgi:ubiquinone/menaquinone biosynthesis C-methylase UbiE